MSFTGTYGCQTLEKEVNGVCVHKDMWPPTLIEILAYILIFAFSNLSNATGIGGGGVLIPLLILLMNFPAHNAIPLSKAIIFGGAIVSVFLNLRQSQILIDFRIVSILQPMILLGTAIGVVLNKVFPDWIIIILMTLTLSIVIYKNFSKAISLYKIETIGKKMS
jgi:Predicted permeases